jgi:hypothetical protein
LRIVWQAKFRKATWVGGSLQFKVQKDNPASIFRGAEKEEKREEREKVDFAFLNLTETERG